MDMIGVCVCVCVCVCDLVCLCVLVAQYVLPLHRAVCPQRRPLQFFT